MSWYSQQTDADDRENEKGGGKEYQLLILAFPTNDFNQEPGSNDEIKENVMKLLGKETFHNPNFVLFQKSSLRDNPVYNLLQTELPGKTVKHNFYKYLIDKDGVPISFYTKKQTLLEMENDIVNVLPH